MPGRARRPLGRPRSSRSSLHRELSLERLQVLVDEGDRHAALADRRRDPLHRAVADVPAGEDPRDAGLEQVRVAAGLPATPGGRVGAGEDEAVVVERDLRRQPRRLGIRTDQDEEAARLEPGRSRRSRRSARRSRRVTSRRAPPRPPCAASRRCSAAWRSGRRGSATSPSRAPRPGTGSSPSGRGSRRTWRPAPPSSPRRRCARRGRARSRPRSARRRRRCPCRRDVRNRRSRDAAMRRRTPG